MHRADLILLVLLLCVSNAESLFGQEPEPSLPDFSKLEAGDQFDNPDFNSNRSAEEAVAPETNECRNPGPAAADPSAAERRSNESSRRGRFVPPQSN